MTSTLARYAIAVAAAAVAILFREPLTPLWGSGWAFITCFPAVVVSGWLAGFGPGLVTTLLCAGATAYLWMPPPHALDGKAPGDLVALAVFFVIGLLLSGLTDVLRKGRGRLLVSLRELQDEVSSRQKAEEAEARLAAIVQSSDDTIVSKTLNGTITSWNPAAERMFGYAAAEAVGRHISLIIPPDHRAEEDEVLARLRRGESVDHFDTVRVTKDGMLVPVSLTISPVRNARGEIIGASKIARDISARLRAESERAALLASTEAARVEAETANRAKDEFLAMLGHELRNPLGAISNAVHILHRVGNDDDAVVRARDVIARQAQHLARLMDDLLDVSRVISGKTMLEREPMDLGHVVERALNTLHAAGKVDRHRITLQADSAWISGDISRLEQIVTNLVGNALKYTPSTGVIRVRVTRNAGAALLSVEDTGIGISADMLAHIFDPFVQGDQLSGRAPTGLGVGLTLVKKLVELHGGSVEARSVGPGKGSTFTASFPTIPQPAPASATSRHHPDIDHLLRVPPRRVLIVEDNLDAREMLRALLELSHHAVYEAADGPTGLEAAFLYRPDIAFIDIGLPGIDGFEIARLLRAVPDEGRLRLVALSGFGVADHRQRAFDAGFDAYLVKPATPEQLAEIFAMDEPTEA